MIPRYICLALLVLDVSASSNPEESKLQPKDTKIVIVGAGAAGLSAASKLLERNFDVTVLEGRDVIGGRIQSKSVTNGWVELGASVVIESGDLPDQLRELDYLVDAPQQHLLYISDSRGKLNEEGQKEAEELENIFNQLVELMTNTSAEEAKGISTGAFLEGYYKSFTESGESDEFKEYLKDEKNRKFAAAMYDFIVRVYRNQIAADSLHDVAIRTLQESQIDSSIISLLNVPYARVVEFLSAKIPREIVSLNKEVTEIKFTYENGKSDGIVPPIEVKTTDGSVYPAHHVIFTASLGVLKESHSTLFSPNLSSEQQRAISVLEYGVGEKVFLEYDSPFWEELDVNVTNICFLWEGDQKVDKERRYGMAVRSTRSISNAPGSIGPISIHNKPPMKYECSDCISQYRALNAIMPSIQRMMTECQRRKGFGYQ